jgi:anti-sigma B factor antagonist
MTEAGSFPEQPEPFAVTSVDSGDWWCQISLAGELDIATGPQLRQAVADALGRGRRHVAIDAGRLSFIDSGGLVALLTARNEVTAAGGSLRLTDTSAQVTRVLEMAGLADELCDHRR